MISRTESLNQFVAEAPNAMAMFDREMRYIAASPRWLACFGLEACPVGRSHYEDFSQIPDAWKHACQRCLAGASETEEAHVPASDGRSRRVRCLVRPWRNGEGAIGGLVIAGEDVDDRVEAHRKADDLARRAQESERYLKEALDAIPGGFAIYDADDRLVVFNKAMRAMYRFRDDEIFPGARFEDLLNLAAEKGLYGRTGTARATLVRDRLKRHRNPTHATEYQLDDGRWLLAEERRTPDGGRVVIRTDITHLKNREQELARKTALLEATLQNMGEGIAVFGPDLKVLTYNQLAAQLLDTPRELNRPGVSFEDLTRFRAARGDYGDVDVEVIVGEGVARFRNGQPWNWTHPLPNGRVIDARFHPMPDGGGVYVFSDVTALADREAKLARNAALLRGTVDNLGAGVAVYDADGRLTVTNALAARLLDAPPALLEPGAALEDLIRFRVERGDLGEVDVEACVRERGARFNAGKSWSLDVRHGDSRVTETRFNPLPDGGGVFVFEDVTERERIRAKIHEEEAKFRGLVEQDVAGIAIVREDGTIGYCNGQYARMLGYEPAELLGHALFEFIPEDGRRNILSGRKRLFATGAPYQIALPVRARGGRIVEALVNVSRIPFEGGHASMAVVIDITDRKKAEDALRASEERFRMLIEEAPDGVMLYDCDKDRFIAANRAAERLHGASRQALLDREPQSFFSPGQPDGRPVAQTFLEHVERALKGEIVILERRIRRPSGEERLCRATLVRLPSKAGLLRVSLVDVTEQRAAEDALRASERRLRMLIEGAPDAILLLDYDQDRLVDANRAAERLFGVPRAALIERGPRAFYAPQQPDDLPAAQSYPQHNIRALTGEEVTFERRIRRPSGEDRICRVTLVRLPSKFNLLRSSLVDVTEQRAAEESLRASEERFRMLIEEAPDAILLFDCDENRYIAANKAAVRLFGAPRDRLLELGPRPFYPSEQPDAQPVSSSADEHLARALNGEQVTFERRIRRLSGEERVCRVTLVALQSKGRLIRASFVDVTEQKAAEVELSEVQRDIVARQEAQRQRIARELHDSLGQYLAAMNIKLQLLAQTVGNDAPLKSGLADLKTLTSTVGNEVSRIAWELRPTAIDDIGLETAIHRFVEEWASRSGLRFDLHLALKDRRLPPNVETTLYRMLQEGVTNVVKHAGARNVGVVLKESPGGVVMIVEDDGTGFEVDSLSRPSSRLGLLGMRERLAAVHGTLEIESRPGEGVALIIHVPLDR